MKVQKMYNSFRFWSRFRAQLSLIKAYHISFVENRHRAKDESVHFFIQTNSTKDSLLVGRKSRGIVVAEASRQRGWDEFSF